MRPKGPDDKKDGTEKDTDNDKMYPDQLVKRLREIQYPDLEKLDFIDIEPMRKERIKE